MMIRWIVWFLLSALFSAAQQPGPVKGFTEYFSQPFYPTATPKETLALFPAGNLQLEDPQGTRPLLQELGDSIGAWYAPVLDRMERLAADKTGATPAWGIWITKYRQASNGLPPASARILMTRELTMRPPSSKLPWCMPSAPLSATGTRITEKVKSIELLLDGKAMAESDQQLEQQFLKKMTDRHAQLTGKPDDLQTQMRYSKAFWEEEYRLRYQNWQQHHQRFVQAAKEADALLAGCNDGYGLAGNDRQLLTMLADMKTRLMETAVKDVEVAQAVIRQAQLAAANMQYFESLLQTLPKS